MGSLVRPPIHSDCKNLYILTESASPAGLAAVFNRLRSTQPIGYGIKFFRASGRLIPLTRQFFIENKIIMEDFIVGVSINNLLYPIYDKNHQAVVVRVSDRMNIPIGAFDALEIPFYKEVHRRILPTRHQPGEGSSRGNN